VLDGGEHGARLESPGRPQLVFIFFLRRFDCIPRLAVTMNVGPLVGVRPCGWTESSWRFDRLPGALILELSWTQVT
jgi:hypothetical protein